MKTSSFKSLSITKSDYPFLTDWVAISFRWLALVLAALMLTISKSWVLPETGALLFLSVWNIMMALLAILNQRLPYHRFFNVIVDLIVSISFFISTGGIDGPLIWIGILCFFSAAIYFEWLGSAVSFVVVTILQYLWTSFIQNPIEIAPTTSFSVLVLINISINIILGLMSIGIIKGTQNIFRSHKNQNDLLRNSSRLSERNRLQTFYQMIETLSATLNYQLVLETSLDISINALSNSPNETSNIIAAVLLFGDSEMKVGAARGFSPRDLGMKISGENGIIALVLQNGEAELLTNPQTDPEISHFASFSRCKSVLALPLIRGLNAYGVSIFGHPDSDFFSKEHIEMLEMISHQSVIAIQNARLFQDIEAEKQRIIISQDNARKELARELHDGPTQTVSAVAMDLNTVQHVLEKMPLDQLKPELGRIETTARNAVKELRHMLFTLRPLVMESEGLIAALNAMAEKMLDTYKQKVVIDIDPSIIDKLDENKQNVIFHLTDEAVNNARKHAKAKQILVRLKPFEKDDRICILDIIDNGVGFDVKAVTSNYEKRGSLGMINLRERTDLVSGILKIDSVSGKGTRIRAYIPLTQEAADLLQQGKTNT